MAGWLIRAEGDGVGLTADEPEPEPDSAAGIARPATGGQTGATGPRRTGKERGRATAAALGPGGAVAPADAVAEPFAAVSAEAQAAAAAEDAVAETVGKAATTETATRLPKNGSGGAATKPPAPAVADDPWAASRSGTPLAESPPAANGATGEPAAAAAASAPTAVGATRSTGLPADLAAGPATSTVPAESTTAATTPATDIAAPVTPLIPAGTAPASLPDTSWPRTADVVAALLELAQLYGDGQAGTPGYVTLTTSSPTGSGMSAATAAQLEQALYQENQAAAYRSLDTALAKYLDGLAGTNAGYRAQAQDIVNRVDAQLRALGASALSPSGSEELRQLILAKALADAQQIFQAGKSSAAATQQEVDQLAKVYLDALDPAPANTPVSGTVGQWINQAIAVLEQLGYPAGALNPAALATIIAHESGGNPYAVNLTDSNAAAGDPSKGLMQTISTTFAQYAAPGHGNIWNPVDNIVAGARYAIARYGSLNNVPGVVAVQNGGGYVGY